MARISILPRFIPSDPPLASEEMRPVVEYFYRELSRVSAMLEVLANGYIEESHVPPERLDDGMIRRADGTNWDPGSGRGIYWYDSVTAAWKLLG